MYIHTRIIKRACICKQTPVHENTIAQTTSDAHAYCTFAPRTHTGSDSMQTHPCIYPQVNTPSYTYTHTSHTHTNTHVRKNMRAHTPTHHTAHIHTFK